MPELVTRDKHPALAVKDACLARSGVYLYTYDEMLARGFKPATKKPVYTEYRPKEVLQRCKDKFAFAAVTKEHTLEETNHTNFNRQATGVIGDNIQLKELDDGELGIFGKMAFYTKDGYDYYLAGNKETSADYRSVVTQDTTGQYDFILRDIISVNGVVVTAAGRGGPSVRVMDSAKNIFGGIQMAGKTGIFAGLFGRSKDEGFKLSKVVLDCARTLHTLDAAGQEKAIGEAVSHVADLPDGVNKERLIGAVKDSLKQPMEAVKHEEKVARVIDGLYAAALADDKETQDFIASLAEGKTKTKDSTDADADKKDEKDGDAEKKTQDGKPVDFEKLIDTAVDKAVARVSDSIGALIDQKVKDALGIKDDDKKGAADGGSDSHTQDSVLDDVTREEGAFLLETSFGGRR